MEGMGVLPETIQEMAVVMAQMWKKLMYETLPNSLRCLRGNLQSSFSFWINQAR